MTNTQGTEKLLASLLDQQRQVVTTLDRPVFVAAGAGSGKTFTLTRRIVWALSKGSATPDTSYLESLDEALIITYTNKAAAEIKERVRSALREAGLEQEALKVDSAWISTIHGMCARILRENALDLGIDPQFVMLPAEQAASLREHAIDEALLELADDRSLDALFAEYGAGPFDVRQDNVAKVLSLMLGAAGSALYGLESLGFIGGAADFDTTIAELAEAYAEFMERECNNNTELELCEATNQALQAYVNAAPSAHTLEAAHTLLENAHVPDYSSWVYRGAAPGAKAARSLVTSALERAKAEVAYSRANTLQEPLLRLVHAVNKRLDASKAAQSFLDNDDLLQRCAKAFREHPDIAARYTNKFKLVMVDEFQDTNDQQVNMIKSLSQDGEHLTTVGDAQQSIYAFRGADVGVFSRRGAEVSADATVQLTTNFRSDDAILRFVKSTCSNTGIVPDFMDLVCDKGRDNTFVDSLGAPINHPRVIIEYTRSWSEAAKYLRRYSADSGLRTLVVAEQLADRLARLKAAGIAPARMAVLMNSLKTSGVYIEALRRRGIESVVSGGSTFASQPEVKAIAALLHVLANPADTQLGLFPVLSSPMFELDANDMLLLATKNQVRAQDKETVEVDVPAKRSIDVGLRGKLYGGLKGSARFQFAQKTLERAWQRVGKLPIADVVLMCVRESGWLARLEKQGTTGRSVAANVLAAVRHIKELAEPQGLDAILAAQAFEAWLADSKEHPAVLSGAASDAVRFMTVHASKGLEFDVVAVVGCCNPYIRTPLLLSHSDGDTVELSLAPSKAALPKDDDETLAAPLKSASSLEWRRYLDAEYKHAQELEAGRLLYVALTRAKECVILSLDGLVTSKGEIKPDMCGKITSEFDISFAAPGMSTFDYEGAEPGLVRVATLVRQEDGESHALDAGGTLEGVPSILYPQTSLAGQEASGTDEEASVSSDAPSGQTSSSSQDDGTFDIFNIKTETEAPLAFWQMRTGIYDAFSYSSAHSTIAHSDGALTLDDVFDLPQPLPLSEAELARADIFPHDEYIEPRKKHEQIQISMLPPEEEGSEQESGDADRATNLGSAFHELARFMVETGSVPDEKRIRAVGHSYAVTSKRDLERLSSALKRWESSDLRKEVLSHACVRAEVPFCCNVDSQLGSKLDGAIDLLATDGLDATASDTALLVDYKTGDHGLTFAQIRERHEMQARFYAYVLQLQGYKHITCAFVCVELEDSAAQPVVTTYRF